MIDSDSKSSSGVPAPERVRSRCSCPIGRMRSDSKAHGEGQALALREGDRFFTVARGPVPRDRCMARDRPSPYVKGTVFRPRNPPLPDRGGPRMPHAHPRGFPPRTFGSPQPGEGQALALRGRGVFFRSAGPSDATRASERVSPRR